MSDKLKLTPELHHFAEEQVRAGNFANIDQVARAAFALLRQNGEQREMVRRELAERFAEMDAGMATLTTDDEFAGMVHQRAAKYSGQ